MKKVNGKNKEEHYTRTDYSTGEMIKIHPEYTTMSRRPGVGYGWLEKYYKDVFRDDFVIYDGLKFKPAKYYDSFNSNIEETKEIRRLHFKLLISIFGLSTAFCIGSSNQRSIEDHTREAHALQLRSVCVCDRNRVEFFSFLFC